MILAKVVMFLVIFSALLFLLQSRMIYFPRSYTKDWLSAAQENAREIEYKTDQGQQIAFYVAPKNSDLKAPKTLWLVFGGNGSLALHWLDFVLDYPVQDAGFLLIDYPGYGKCKGRPSPGRIRVSTEKAFETLRESLGAESLRDTRVSVLGHSLGVGAALNFAAEHDIEKAVMVSPFTSMLDMARRAVGVPLCYLLRHRFDNRARIAELVQRSAPPKLCIIHGDRDDVIPVRMGRDLAKTFSKYIEYKEIAGADHNHILSSHEEHIFEAML